MHNLSTKTYDDMPGEFVPCNIHTTAYISYSMYLSVNGLYDSIDGTLRQKERSTRG